MKDDLRFLAKWLSGVAALTMLCLGTLRCAAWESIPQPDRTVIIRVIADGALRAAGVEGAQPAKLIEVEMTPEELLAFLASGARTPEDVVAIAHLAGALRTTGLIPGGVPRAPLAEDAASSQRPPIREGGPSCACGVELPREIVDTLFRSPAWIEVPNGDRRPEALQRQVALTALGDWLVAHPLCSARPGDGKAVTP